MVGDRAGTSIQIQPGLISGPELRVQRPPESAVQVGVVANLKKTTKNPNNTQQVF